jgi:exodeoxyribonuclease VII large subunit
MLRAGTAPRILTVSQLAGSIRDALHGHVGAAWVAGEISNFRRQPSGHCYFTLKDDQCQLGAVMFQSAARVLPFKPADGMEVVAYVRVSLYPARGTLQLYVDTM